MFKTTLATVAIAALAPAGAIAGPYANVEANSGFSGSDYGGTVTEAHAGYEGPLGEDASWYMQAGPAFVSPDSGSSYTALSGKGGASVSITEKFDIYGELSFITGEDGADNSYGTKIGAKYSF